MAAGATNKSILIPSPLVPSDDKWQAYQWGELLQHLRDDLNLDQTNLDASSVAAAVIAAGDSAWRPVTYQNAWATTGGSQPAQFRKDGLGWVHLRGRITGGANSSVAFTLPVGYRASDVNTLIPIGCFNGGAASGGFMNCGGSTGAMSIWYPAGFGDVGFTGISFLAEA